MSTQTKKHKKAILVTAFVAAILAVPVLYLLHLYENDSKISTEGMGLVGDYAYYFDNQTGGITTKDSDRFIFLMGVFKSSDSKEDIEASLVKLDSLKKWSEDQLTEKVGDIGNPPGLKYILMTDTDLPQVDKSWGVIKISESQKFLLPANKKDDKSPAIVLVDDHGYYRGYLPLSDESSLDTAKKELTKMISNQFLQYYIKMQQLELKKSKPRLK
jgi:hypothetical protein